MYRAVRATGGAGRGEDRRRQDAAVARRLLLVALSDACCWIPVGVIGLLAQADVPIPGDLNVVAAVVVLPLNSALNPFLYTLGVLAERRARRREAQRVARMLGKLRVEVVTWSDVRLRELHGQLQELLMRFENQVQALGESLT